MCQNSHAMQLRLTHMSDGVSKRYKSGVVTPETWSGTAQGTALRSSVGTPRLVDSACCGRDGVCVARSDSRDLHTKDGIGPGELFDRQVDQYRSGAECSVRGHDPSSTGFSYGSLARDVTPCIKASCAVQPGRGR
jgi:hypothetical protein